MAGHVCPWWGGYFLDHRFRRLIHKPELILAPYVRRGMTVMDFGCGMGFFAIAMAEMVGEEGRVLAVDLQPQMLDVLHKRAERAGVAQRIRKLVCDRHCFHVDDSVDFALAFWSAHEVPEIGQFLRGVHECLVDGGKVLVAEPKGHVSAMAFRKMASLAEEIGFGLGEQPRVRMSRAITFIKEAPDAR